MEQEAVAEESAGLKMKTYASGEVNVAVGANSAVLSNSASNCDGAGRSGDNLGEFFNIY